jgi:hypothetical protein
MIRVQGPALAGAEARSAIGISKRKTPETAWTAKNRLFCDGKYS